MSSCHNEREMQWYMSDNGILVWDIVRDQSVSYSWQGNSTSGVANGVGKLSITRGNEILFSSQCEMKYGAINNAGYKYIDSNQHFIGKVSEGMLSGFCVLIKGDETYIGNFVSSKPEGKVDLYKNGKLYYSGEWIQGTICGEGTLYREDGSVLSGVWENGKIKETNSAAITEYGKYQGDIRDNKPEGYGQMNYYNGCCYTGQWRNGCWEGEGVLTTNEFIFSGNWENNLPEGYGELSFADSSNYKGIWSEGRRNEWGECKYSNGDSYLGEWENDLPNGEGTYKYHNGSIYDGEWKSGLPNGLGEYICSAFRYEGDWDEGWANGIGRFTYFNGDQYDGHVVENQRYGQGTYFFENGNVYEGEFVEDTFNGLGIFHFSDGSWYEGEFRNGKFCGDGTYSYEDEEGIISITAAWDGSNNFPQKASILFPNGDIFEGLILDGVPSNDGIWITADGKQHNSDWMAKYSQYYDSHKKAINRGVLIASAAIGIASIALPGGWAVAATALNTTLNVVDAATSISNEVYKGNYAAAKFEAGINLAFIAAPPILRKPARKAAAVLSKPAKQIIKPIMSSIGESKAVKQVVKVVKDKAGIIGKKITKAIPQKIKKSIPQKSFQSYYLATKLAKTLIKKKLDEIKKKGAIKLTALEMQQLKEHPKDYIRHFILAKTGSKKNFQEFFIRLAMGDKKQVIELLSIPEIRQFVDYSIRHSGEGGVHEWLMTKNFGDFLTNPKWGDDGYFLSLALTELVQKTSRLLFKAGGQHHMANSGKFHIELAKVISSCSSKEELFIAIHKFAKNWLTDESYKEFCQIFKEVFLTAIESSKQ